MMLDKAAVPAAAAAAPSTTLAGPPAGKAPVPTTAPPAIGVAATAGTTNGNVAHVLSTTTEAVETTTSGVMALFDWNIVHLMVFVLWMMYFIPIFISFLNRKQTQFWKRWTLPKPKKPSAQKN